MIIVQRRKEHVDVGDNVVLLPPEPLTAELLIYIARFNSADGSIDPFMVGEWLEGGSRVHTNFNSWQRVA